MSRLDADQARSAGAAAIEAIEQRAWPFDEAAWASWVPPSHFAVPRLPIGWDDPF